METKRWQESDIKEIVAALMNDGVVAFPTETVYGLGIRYGSNEAISRLVEAKKRDESKRFTLMLSHIEDIPGYAYVDDIAWKVILAFMPGDITIILNSRFEDRTIGIRVPDHAFTCQLIDACKCPLYVTSANISGGKNANTTDEVLAQLDGRIDGIVEGRSGGRMPSSVISLIDGVKVLREGRITKEMIEEEIK